MHDPGLVPSDPQILDEDLQIIRVTLAAITEQVRFFSTSAADAMQEALQKLDMAQQEFSHINESH
ncbi:MAG: hypothetical protein PHE83_09630 [Opitutaceae bacterium]|nr:hypothetical protein [Opitutaceae bacterium]